MTFDVEAARQWGRTNPHASGGRLLAACDEIERMRERVDAQEESLVNLTDEYTGLRNQLGIAAVALGRIADYEDNMSDYDEPSAYAAAHSCGDLAREALLRMREGQGVRLSDHHSE